MKICVIFNPVAKGNKARRFRQTLDELERDCTLKPTLTAGDARRLAKEAVQEGYDTIVAAGGDGTVNEVINGMADAPQGLERARFGVLPLGTVNVFARELKLPLNITAAWDCLRSGKEIQIDLPKVEYGEGSARAQRYFVQMAGAGFDARTEELMEWQMKKRVGVMAYVMAALKAMRERRVEVVVDNGKEQLPGELVLIGNGRYYAGSFLVFPQADARDGFLEVTVVPKVNVVAALRSAWGLLSGRLYTWGGARRLQGQAVSVSSKERALFQVEGEIAGTLPAKFSVGGEKIRVLAGGM